MYRRKQEGDKEIIYSIALLFVRVVRSQSDHIFLRSNKCVMNYLIMNTLERTSKI
jgi:hypothetical protein